MCVPSPCSISSGPWGSSAEETHTEGGVGSRTDSLLLQFGDCHNGEWSWDAAAKGPGRVRVGQGRTSLAISH